MSNSQRDFLHAEIDQKKIKVDLKFFSLMKSKSLGQSDCIIPKNQLYLK